MPFPPDFLDNEFPLKLAVDQCYNFLSFFLILVNAQVSVVVRFFNLFLLIESLANEMLLKFPDTYNELQEEVGGYEHIVVLSNIGVVDGNAVDLLQNLPRGNFPGDCILNQFLMDNICLLFLIRSFLLVCCI